MNSRPDGRGDTLFSAAPTELGAASGDFARFMLAHKFAIDEVMTKVNILQQEFAYMHDYSPIEQVSSRLKTPAAIAAKAARIGCPLDFDEIRAQMNDVAGVRVTCSFISDVYRVRDMLAQQPDLHVVVVKDYVANPKANGYRSLHLIVSVPVFLSDREERVRVEIQIRTVAMDFWASLEHKIFYKYDQVVPPGLREELGEAAAAAHQLDKTMERLHFEVTGQRGRPTETHTHPSLPEEGRD